MSYIVFFIAALGTLAGAIGVITLKDPFYSVLALVVHLISLAVLFMLLQAEFVAAAQVVVYAGAVMVLYVFVVSYVGGESLTGSGGPGRAGTVGAFVCGGALVIELFIAVLGSGLKAIGTTGARRPGFRRPRADRNAVPDQVPRAVRDRVLPAAARGGRRGDAGAAARRPRGRGRGPRDNQRG
jgi:NADH-quinone oxidoreductase subunit J